MLKKRQVVRLILVSLALWAVATAYIKAWPSTFTDPMQGAIGFITTFPMAWLSIWLIKRAGGLSAEQLLPGVAIVGAVAMMIDGAALRFAHQVYGADEATLRLGAAWLLWGYGVSLAIALIWTRSRGGAVRS